MANMLISIASRQLAVLEGNSLVIRVIQTNYVDGNYVIDI